MREQLEALTQFVVSWLYPAVLNTGLVVVSLFLCYQSSAESALPLIDDRCEQDKLVVSFSERVLKPCDAEVNSCIEDRMSKYNEPLEKARTACWQRPLPIDSRFIGPCPRYMVKIEANESTSDESVMEKIWLRNGFGQLNENGRATIDVFKREESLEITRRIFRSDPQNPIALELLSWLNTFSGDDVEQVDLELKEYALDSDCPQTINMLPRFLFGNVNAITDNWLAGKGPGAELSMVEIRRLFVRVQHTLLESYDIAIEQRQEETKIRKALESIYDPILSRVFENFQQIASLVEIGLEDYATNRRESLIRRFSREFDVDSHHGRKRSFSTVCNNFALELGLLNHCVKLLLHFGQEDSRSSRTPSSDWTRAAITLLNAVTRDCSEHPTETLFAPVWWNERRCFEGEHRELASYIRELLGSFSKPENSAEHEVLIAYLQLDEASDELFLRALSMDESVVFFAALLSKRLHRLGKVETASYILDGVDAAKRNQLTSDEKCLFDQTSNSISEDLYRNWNEAAVDYEGNVHGCIISL